MTKELGVAHVPRLSDEWIARRQEHLVAEVTTPASRRPRRRLVLGATGAGVLSAAAIAVGVVGPWASPAFAGWSPDTTAPTPGQVSVAESTCASQYATLAAPDGSTPGPLPAVSLTDVRGPYTLVVYAASSDPVFCVTSPTFTAVNTGGFGSMGGIPAGGAGDNTVTGGSTQGGTPVGGSETNSAVRVLGDSNAAASTPDSAAIAFEFSTSGNGQPLSVAEGQVGANVTGVAVVLDDSTAVNSTTANGHFVAWWPGQVHVDHLQVTTSGASS
ncbi:MAG: hypothetical protein ACRDV0_02645 [Acidimicrobiales bacterium]